MPTATKKRTRVKPDELDAMSSGVPKGGCPRCRNKATVGFVKIDIIKYGPEKSAKGAKHIKSKSRSMCATCIKAVFLSLNETFEEEVNAGG